MDEQERRVITDIFGRLEQVAQQSRDPEAERFIAEKVRQQPYAPYAMAQALHIQEQALANLNAQVEQLSAEVEELRRQPAHGGLLAGLFGGSRAPDPGRAVGNSPWRRGGPQPAPAGYEPAAPGMGGQGPWGQQQPMGQQAFGQQGPAGGGFLRNAMATAAGVAGGVMIANALSHAFGGGQGSEPAAGSSDASKLGEFGNDQGGGAGDDGGITDSLYQDASTNNEQDYGQDDFGDNGDDGDWS